MRRLGIFVSFILIIIGLEACQVDEQPVVRPTLTPTALTATAVPLASTGQPTPPRFATASLTPGLTPTPEPTGPTAGPTSTLTPVVYLTPSTPAAELSQYRLVPWTAEHADNLGRLMESYTEMTGRYFYSTFTEQIDRGQISFPALAYREAQLFFPDDPNVGRWLLGEIVNEARSGVNNEERFREIIVDALNNGAISLEENELADWFGSYPSYFNIGVDELRPLPGYENAHLLTISLGYDGGGMVALILENQNSYSSYPVFSYVGNITAAEMSIYLGDMTNDDWPEVIVLAGTHNGTIIYTYVLVYDLSQTIPQQLSFEDRVTLAPNFVLSVSSVTDANGTDRLQIAGGENFSCPLTYIGAFTWNNQWFELTDYENTSQHNDFSTCLDKLLHPESYWWLQFSDIERQVILNLFETEFDPSQPPQKNSMSGEAYPPEYEDEVRYILAMNHAVLGHVAEAQGYLRVIMDDPAVPDSSWVEPAELFLDNYQGVEDVYRACLAAGRCDTALALERTVRTLPVSDYGNIVGRLTDLGATVLNSGTFDFENDQSAETWVILRGLPGEPLEMWLLAETEEGIAAEFIDEVTTLSPSFNHNATTGTQSFRNEPLYDYVPFTIGTGDVYSFVRRQRDGKPFVTKLLPVWTAPPQAADPLEVEFDEAVEALFAGDDPVVVAERLTAVINDPAITPGSYHYYYQGLAYQLAGDAERAVAAYVWAWQNCCIEWNYGSEGFVTADPYAIMAQTKLEVGN